MAYATINKGSSYFNTVLYTGTGATNNITGVGFQPDWTWIKCRNSGADWHRLLDAVRGATKELYSNATNAESTQAQSLQSFNTDGFTLGTLAEVNANANTFASWNWLASNTTTSNTAGSISSTISANPTAGFSIVSYTGNGTSGATIGHGLGAVPKMMIVKKRSSSGDWRIYNVSMGNTNVIEFTTDAQIANLGSWNNTTPTSSVFSVGNSIAVNENGSTFIAYCFAEIKGYSAFGSYTGNGSTDGTFIYTGFKPAYVMIKVSSNSGDGWFIFDNKRTTYNVMSTFLLANSSAADETNTNRNIDFLSNGFKLRNSDTSLNYSAYTYIYMAFAENPFVLTDGTPVTAR